MLELVNLNKKYPDFSIIDLSLRVEEGEYFVLLGRSGSGKSLTLELIAGLRSPDSGSVILNNIDITDVKIQQRRVGMVFQDFAVFPHLTVFENIAYPLRMKREKKEDIGKKVKNMAWEMNIESLLERKPDTLSGGERQRVAVARTLVTSPDIILLDEPMASIDTPLRDDVRRLLRKINRKGVTVLHVTHDYREAIRLADRVGVLHNGRLVQTGKPDEVFMNPVNRFVARFAGIQNFLSVSIEKDNNVNFAVCKSGNRLKLPVGDCPQKGILMVRNDSITISLEPPQAVDNIVEGTINELNRSEFGYEAYVDAGEIFYVNFSDAEYNQMKLEIGNRIFLSFPDSALKVIG